MFGPADLEEDEINVLGDEPYDILRYYKLLFLLFIIISVVYRIVICI
jgi:hypothetical protein